MIELLHFFVVVLVVDECDGRTKSGSLRPSCLQDQRLHLRLVLLQSLQVIVQHQYLPWLQLLHGMQPAQVDHGLPDEYDESDAVRSGDELRLQLYHLSVYENLGFLQQQLQCPGLIHVLHRTGFYLTAVLG